MSSKLRDQAYQIYLDFLETAETKRRWNIFTDVPWEKLDLDKATADVGKCVEIFCTEELYVPDYTSRGLDLSDWSLERRGSRFAGPLKNPAMDWPFGST